MPEHATVADAVLDYVRQERGPVPVKYVREELSMLAKQFPSAWPAGLENQTSIVAAISELLKAERLRLRDDESIEYVPRAEPAAPKQTGMF